MLNEESAPITIHTELCPPGSHKVYIFTEGGSYEERSHINTTCLFSPYRDGVLCHFVKGHLNNEVNEAIAAKAFKMGWHTMYLTRPAGANVTRWAQFSHTEDGLDHYTVDLKALVEGKE